MTALNVWLQMSTGPASCIPSFTAVALLPLPFIKLRKIWSKTQVEHTLNFDWRSLRGS